MLKLNQLEYRNIMAVGNHAVTINFDEDHTTLIGGQNGSGKSTVVLALVYCLYGKIINGMKLAQAINSSNKKALLTKCKFETNGEEWEVVRGEKPKKFELYKNGEKIDQYANARDQQKFLEVKLGMDYKLFTQIVVINKERYIPFMEMSAADRRKIVEDILGISIFSYMNEETKKRITEQKRLVSNLERDAQVKKTEIEGQQKLISEVRSSIKEASESVAEELTEKNNQLIKLDEEKTSLLEQKQELIEKLEPHAKVKKQIKDFEKLSSEFSHQYKQASNHAKFFLDNDVCPTCNQDISNELKDQKKSEAETKVSEIEETIGELTVELEKTLEQDEAFSKLQDQLSEYRQQIQQLDFKMSSLEADIDALEKKSKTSSNNDKLDTYINQYEQLETSLESILDDLRVALDQSELLEMMKELLKDDGIKSLIVKDYNKIMNQYINDYLQAMGYYVNVTIDENFNEKFHSMGKESFSYENLSSGQKTRLNLAITLALLQVASVKNSAVCNVLVADELLEPVDKQGIEDVMGLFREKLPTKNIFVVTQRFDEFFDKFDSSIQFKLNNDFTEIVE